MAKAFLENFKSLKVAVITISDTRNLQTDTSGAFLEEALIKQGHIFKGRFIVTDDIEKIQNKVKKLVSENIDIIITTGGTGFTKRDNTPEAILPLLNKKVEGFGELFRYLSYKDIETSTLQSRAFAGFIENTLLFALPGSKGAVSLGWNDILAKQLNSTTKPCNFAALIHLEYSKDG